MKISDLYHYYTQHYLVDTDTRNIRKNTLFFALKGANFNGNTFAEQALALGASYAIVEEVQYQTKDNIILVPNVLETLQQLANYHRKQLQTTIIGLTGSNGKTTTKELIHAVLSTSYTTVATKGNLNNHIGVPLTLLSIRPETDIAIVEMGANHQKEIAFLSAICEPDYGYITNFGKAHLEGFGGVKGVIKGKSELYTFLEQHNKKAFVNPDDPIQVEKTTNISSITFNSKHIKCVAVHPFIKVAYKKKMIQSNLIGTYNFTNIAAALTMGAHFKVSEENLKKGIENYVPQNNRSQIITTKTHKVILDAYNANPSSMKVALEHFASLKEENQLIILGDMFELGEESEKEHQRMADLARALELENQFLIGEHFYKVHTTHKKFKTFDEFKSYINEHPIQQKSILIKGSRGMRLERILEFLE